MWSKFSSTLSSKSSKSSKSWKSSPIISIPVTSKEKKVKNNLSSHCLDNDHSVAFLTKYLAHAFTEFQEEWAKDTKNEDDIDKFALRKALGSGSFGQVVAATHSGHSKAASNLPPLVAIKIMKKADVIKTNQIEHTMSEKKVSLTLNSDFLMKTFYAFQDPVNLYIIMEFMSGGEFYLFFRQKGHFAEAMSQFYASQVVLALQYLHTMKLVYRDLKPENILIGDNGYIKIGDFGFAKLVPGKTWTLCGTPQYMAPELLTHKSYGKSVDCWGLGIFIYEICAGYPPFDDPNPMKMYDKIVVCDMAYPKSFSKELVDLLQSLIQVDVTKRYGNLKDGMYDVITHVWFKKMDFVRIHKQQYKAPWKPNAQQIFNNLQKSQARIKLAKTYKDAYMKEFEHF